MRFSFGDHVLDTERRELRHGAGLIAVEPQVFDLLVYLLTNCHRVVSKDDLIASIWQGRIVSDSTVTSRINAARKAVGDSGDIQKLIRTIPRKGFCRRDLHPEKQRQAVASSTEAALLELRRVQPDVSLEWIAKQIPIEDDSEREQYLEGFRRAGLD